MNVLIKKLNSLATIPTYATPHSAGADLFATTEFILAPGERHLFKTGLSMSIPSGVYGRIAPRSGLANKNGIDVLAGVIDEDYRGDVGVILINHDALNYKQVLVGDKIAQIIFEKYAVAAFTEVDALLDTVRGEGGFGSTDQQPGWQKLPA